MSVELIQAVLLAFAVMVITMPAYIRLLRYVGKRVTRHAAGRLLPLLAAPIGAVQNSAGTKDLGSRAITYYGEDPQARP